jgi:hypothetical protein
MSGEAEDLSDLLGPEPTPPEPLPGGRELLKRSRSYDVQRAAKPKKFSQERLKRLLDACAEMPVANSACMRANIHMTTLKYWLQKSSEGAPGDGFDIVYGEGDDQISIRFHEAWDSAMAAGVEAVEAATIQRAKGYREVLTFQGRVKYQEDPEKIALGLTGADAYMVDEFGAPIPETVLKQDPDLMMFILKARKPEVYGTKQQIDVNHRGGVLVVGMTAKTPQDLNTIEAEYRREGRPAVTFEESDD